MSDDADTRIAIHEAICAERYKRIEDSLCSGEKRMTKIEYLLYAVIACVLLGLNKQPANPRLDAC
jgi:hypothetical protein